MNKNNVKVLLVAAIPVLAIAFILILIGGWFTAAHFFGPNSEWGKEQAAKEKRAEALALKKEKDEFRENLLFDLRSDVEYLDSLIPRASVTKSIPLLTGFVHDADKMANKTIEDTRYIDVYKEKEIVDLMEANSKKAKEILPELKKVCRRQYAKCLGQELWEDDIDVKTTDGGKTIVFTGAVFAANRNIKDFNERFYPTFHDLGFTKAIYKWYKYDEDYTYYTIE